MKTNIILRTPAILFFLWACFLSVETAKAGAVIIVANGAGGGPVITTSSGANLDLGTRLRVGRFTDTSNLNNTIAQFLSGANDFSATKSLLEGNFVDLGTGGNFGSASQTSALITVNPSQFLFNTTANLTINGVARTMNVANGQLTPVTYSAATGIGNNAPLYLWAAFNNEIGIYRAPAWNTPASDLSNLTVNLSALSLANSGSTVLLGSYIDNATGSDFLALSAVPEPATGSLLLLGGLGLVALRRLRKV